MCNVACIDEAIILVHIEICIFSEFIDISELLSSCLSRSFMFWTTFLVCSRFPEAPFLRDLQNLLNHTLGFPRHAEQNTIRDFVFLSSKLHTEESLVLPGLSGLLGWFCPTDTLSRETTHMLLLSPFAIQAKSFPEIFFDISDCFPAERKEWLMQKWLQEDVVSFMISKRCNKLCHSPRVKLPFVEMSAPWFVNSTYLIWTFGSQFLLSNDQSRATRWVRETCLIVGLLLLRSFLSQLHCLRRCTTVILSERDVRSKELDLCSINPHSDPTLVQSWVWCGSFPPVSRVHAWVGFGILWVFPSTWMTKSHESSAGTPSIRKPSSNDMISDSVELRDTDVCFLHIQLIGTNVRLPKMHRTPPDVDFESSRSPGKSESWNNPKEHC